MDGNGLATGVDGMFNVEACENAGECEVQAVVGDILARTDPTRVHSIPS